MVLCSARIYHLQNGYYLQGMNGNGYLTKNIINPIITDPILGIQGDRKGYLCGWINRKPGEIRYFIVNTVSSSLEWFSAYEKYSNTCKILKIHQPDMNKETNFLSMRSGQHEFINY